MHVFGSENLIILCIHSIFTPFCTQNYRYTIPACFPALQICSSVLWYLLPNIFRSRYVPEDARSNIPVSPINLATDIETTVLAVTWGGESGVISQNDIMWGRITQWLSCDMTSSKLLYIVNTYQMFQNSWLQNAA